MNKRELIDLLVRRTGLGRADVERIVEHTLGAIGNRLASGEEVRLVGFGIFTAVSRQPSRHRHPVTGEAISVTGKRRVRFQAGAHLRARVKAD